MTDQPLIAELEDQLILAQRVELFVSGTSTGDADDRLVAMRNVELDIGHPETRVNHGMKRTYSHGSPDIGIRFTLSVTEEILAYLRTRGMRNTHGVLPVYKWAIKFTSNEGESKTIQVNGKLTQKNYSKGDTAQGEPVGMNCFVRVTDDAEPSAS